MLLIPSRQLLGVTIQAVLPTDIDTAARCLCSVFGDRKHTFLKVRSGEKFSGLLQPVAPDAIAVPAAAGWRCPASASPAASCCSRSHSCGLLEHSYVNTIFNLTRGEGRHRPNRLSNRSCRFREGCLSPRQINPSTLRSSNAVFKVATST